MLSVESESEESMYNTTLHSFSSSSSIKMSVSVGLADTYISTLDASISLNLSKASLAALHLIFARGHSAN